MSIEGPDTRRRKHATEFKNEHELAEMFERQEGRREEDMTPARRAQQETFRERAKELAAQIARDTEIQSTELVDIAATKTIDDLRNSAPSLAADGDETDLPELSADRARVAQAADGIATRSKEQRNLYAQYVIAGAGVCSAIGTIATLTYLAAKETADGRPDPTATVPDTYKDTVTQFVRAWVEKPDPEFWRELSDYVRANEADVSLDDEMMITKVVESLSKDTGWIWTSVDDQESAIRQLVSTYETDKATWQMYLGVLNLKFVNQNSDSGRAEVLPRRMAAHILGLALARIARTSLR